MKLFPLMWHPADFKELTMSEGYIWKYQGMAVCDNLYNTCGQHQPAGMADRQH